MIVMETAMTVEEVIAQCKIQRKKRLVVGMMYQTEIELL